MFYLFVCFSKKENPNFRMYFGIFWYSDSDSVYFSVYGNIIKMYFSTQKSNFRPPKIEMFPEV